MYVVRLVGLPANRVLIISVQSVPVTKLDQHRRAGALFARTPAFMLLAANAGHG